MARSMVIILGQFVRSRVFVISLERSESKMKFRGVWGSKDHSESSAIMQNVVRTARVSCCAGPHLHHPFSQSISFFTLSFERGSEKDNETDSSRLYGMYMV